MKLLTISLFGFSLAAQVNSTASASFFPVSGPLSAAPDATMERSLRTVEPQRTVPPDRTLYRWSVAILAASSAADAGSSWRRPEANPVMAGSGSTFGAGSVAIKLGLVGSSFLLERVILRNRPDLYRHVAWMNFGIAGAQGAIVQHNISLR
ncbi:MAG: hypothetical protein ABSC05_26920 [Candidatus Solibacter sp.]